MSYSYVYTRTERNQCSFKITVSMLLLSEWFKISLLFFLIYILLDIYSQISVLKSLEISLCVDKPSSRYKIRFISFILVWIFRNNFDLFVFYHFVTHSHDSKVTFMRQNTSEKFSFHSCPLHFILSLLHR